MRLWLALTLCVVPCLPAAARDLTLSATWPEAHVGELVTVLQLADGTVAQILRADVDGTVTALDQTLTDLPRQAASVQVALMDDTRILAQSAPIALDSRSDTQSVSLSPVLALSLRAVFDCGAALGVATLSTTGQVTRLSLARNGAEVTRLLAASGDLTAPDGTHAVRNGTQLSLTTPDGTVTLCPSLPAPPVLPVTARAQDGSWTIALAADRTSVTLPSGPVAEGGDSTPPVGAGQAEGGAITFRNAQFTLTLTAARCLRATDTTPYPMAARLVLATGDTGTPGCAGSPLDLLVGRAWSVSTLLGIPVKQDLTLGFAAGQVSGRGTCNLYQANVVFDEGRMNLRDLGTTRVACPTALRNLELRFLDALEQATGFDLGADGTLILRAGPAVVLTATQRR